MLDFLRYIKVRWDVLKKVSTEQVARLRYAERLKLEKQVKDIAWLSVKNKVTLSDVNCKVKRHITKFKEFVRHTEVRMEGTTRHGDRITLLLSNPYPAPYRMVMQVYQPGKAAISIHGNVGYCFEMLASIEEGRNAPI